MISAVRPDRLRRFPFPCSIEHLPVTDSAPAQRRIRPPMKNTAGRRTESDARRSALMAAAQAGDRVACETLLRDCVSFGVGLARRQGVPPDRIDDVVQEVLLTVHRARAAYDPRRSFEAWLRVIVERRPIDVLRQRRRHREREVHAPLASEGYADQTVDLSAGTERKEKTQTDRCGIGRIAAATARGCALSHARREIAGRDSGVDRSQQRIAQGELASGAEGLAPQDGSWSLRWTGPAIA
jgi:RNA polymerase sigma factor (sigma-70 family)